METCAFPNLGFETDPRPGPARSSCSPPDGVERLPPPGDSCRSARSSGSTTAIPASSYEGINVEEVRNRCGAALARRDHVAGRFRGRHPRLAGSATRSATPPRPASRTGGRSSSTPPPGRGASCPRTRTSRDLVARMKLIPIRELIAGQAAPVLRGLDRPRHPAQGHDPAALRRRGAGGPHAAGLPAARLSAASS